jgi:nitrate/nitrite transporter NarK
MAELLGAHSFPWDDVETPGLIAGAAGALMSWVTGGIIFYICNFLLALSGIYFFAVIPYFMFNEQRQVVPLVAAVFGMNAFATGLRVGLLLEASYDTKPFYWYLVALFAYCIFANVVIYARGSNDVAAIEESDQVEQHCLVDTMDMNKTEPLLQVQIV